MLEYIYGKKNALQVNLQDKNIWIIGASSGLGAALAWVFAIEGANVVLSARSADKLQYVFDNLHNEGNHIVAPLDVTDMLSMRRAYEIIMNKWQNIDYVIYCAGIYQPPMWSPFDGQTQLDILDTNLGGVFRMLEIMVPQWEKQAGGHLLLVSSITALGGAPDSLAYGASKAGMSHLAESLSLDLAPYDVTVQLASPGFIDTPMLKAISRKKPAIIAPDKAAWFIRKRLAMPIFEIHFPRRFTLLAKFLRWAFPRSWYLAVTRKGAERLYGKSEAQKSAICSKITE